MNDLAFATSMTTDGVEGRPGQGCRRGLVAETKGSLRLPCPTLYIGQGTLDISAPHITLAWKCTRDTVSYVVGNQRLRTYNPSHEVTSENHLEVRGPDKRYLLRLGRFLCQ